jgi:hypothetical protein
MHRFGASLLLGFRAHLFFSITLVFSDAEERRTHHRPPMTCTGLFPYQSMTKDDNGLLVSAHQQPSQSQWIDTVNYFALDTSFHLCHAYEYDYVDKQVEFEARNEERSNSSSLMQQHLMMRTPQDASIEVELYRKCLFDEDSVVEDLVSFREIPDYLTGDDHESDYPHPYQIDYKSSEDEVVSTITQYIS